MLNTIDETDVLLSAVCQEPEGEVERKVWLFKFTPDNIEKLWAKCSKFPVIFGNIVSDKATFLEYFLGLEGERLMPKGIFFVLDDFVGVYYMTHIIPGIDAEVHYSFFDRRHHGRLDITKLMLKYVFENYGFERLSVEIPMYTAAHNGKKDNKYINAFQFVERLGFKYEGRKRKAIKYKDEWFDVKLFGLLKTEI